MPRWLHWSLVIVAVIAVAAMAVLLLIRWELRKYGTPAPAEAVAAAREQYQARTGLTGLEVVGAKGRGTCAVVQLAEVPPWGVASVAMVKQGGSWHLAQESTEERHFDTDAVRSEEDCLRLAQKSTTP